MRSEYEEYCNTGMLGSYDPGKAVLRQEGASKVAATFRDTAYTVFKTTVYK